MMNLEFLTPVEEDVLVGISNLHPSSIGKNIDVHTPQHFPDLSEVKIALVGVIENRREQNKIRDSFGFSDLRSTFYSLYPGNWNLKIADLGDIQAGEDVEDTEYALHELVRILVDMDIIPIILGGSQDLTYAQYRAYDFIKEMVNVVNIDARFDIGNTDSPINDTSYIGKMIVEQPYNLYNFANIGYQTYLNPPEEIDLIEKLYFEAYRLGNISADIKLAEPILRDADIVSLDIHSVASGISHSIKEQPNGFDGKEICALSRYAGLSEKVSSFGLYNLQNLNPNKSHSLLPAEIIWYFIEGVQYRRNEKDIENSNNFLKYNVPLNSEVLTFYQSKLSNRWWIEIPSAINNKLKNLTFLPCSHADYLEACNQEIPDRWYKASRKNVI